MDSLENDAKFVPASKKPKFWIGICAVAAFAGAAAIGFCICKFLYDKALKECDYSSSLHIDYPKDFTDVVASREAFELALNYSKPCVGGPAEQRMHAVWYDGERVGNYCCDVPKPDTGSHVTQWVTFASSQDLENFAKKAKPQ
jgi:hypothetical protein